MTISDLLPLLLRGLTIGQAAKRLGVERWRVDELLEKAKRELRCRTTLQLVCRLAYDGAREKQRQRERQWRLNNREHYNQRRKAWREKRKERLG